MSRTVAARWRDWSGEGLEHLVLHEATDGIDVEALIIAPPGPETFASRYLIRCDSRWRVRRLKVSVAGQEGTLVLSSDGTGRWMDHSGARRSDLEGAVDVDLSATPFTNTLPIRRLGLRAGQSETIRVVYVLLPGLAPTIARQRYTCIEQGRRYRYESLESDFVREIEVDDDGLVVTYPGLFRRLL